LKNLIFIIILPFFFFSLIKAEDNIFEIKNNEVFLENSGDILELRNKSKQIAFKNAFRVLIEKILSQEDYNKINGSVSIDFESLVTDFKFQKEKISDINYFAIIDVNFDPKKIKLLFSKKNLQTNVFISETFLVIPIMRKFNTLYLWEKDNLWYEFLKNEYEEQGLLKLYFPKKNHKNKLMISANKILVKDIEKINQFLKFHKKRKAIIVFVDEVYNYQKKMFETKIKSFIYQNNEFSDLLITSEGNLNKESKKSQLDILAKTYLRDLQFWWKNKIDTSKNKPEENEVVSLNFATQNIKRSIQLENFLLKILGEQNMVLKEFSKDNVVYDINTDYSVEQINLALEPHDVRLIKNLSQKNYFDVIDEK